MIESSVTLGKEPMNSILTITVKCGKAVQTFRFGSDEDLQADAAARNAEAEHRRICWQDRQLPEGRRGQPLTNSLAAAFACAQPLKG